MSQSSPAPPRLLPAGPRWDSHWDSSWLAAGRPTRPSASAGSPPSRPRAAVTRPTHSGQLDVGAYFSSPGYSCHLQLWRLVRHDGRPPLTAACCINSTQSSTADHLPTHDKTTHRRYMSHEEMGEHACWRVRPSGSEHRRDEWIKSSLRVSDLKASLHQFVSARRRRRQSCQRRTTSCFSAKSF